MKNKLLKFSVATLLLLIAGVAMAQTDCCAELVECCLEMLGCCD